MNKMKILVGSILMLGCGCSTMSNTDRGVVGGGLIGAGAGALVGAALKNPAAGAAIGGISGAAIGGLTGAAVDNAEARGHAKGVYDLQTAQAAQAAQKRMSVYDVITLTHNHVSEDVIIQHIYTSGSTFQLTAQDILTLKQNGVSDRVVQEMQKRQYQPLAVAPAPMVKHVTVIHQPPPPPPPVSFGIGFYSRPHYHRHPHCW